MSVEKDTAPEYFEELLRNSSREQLENVLMELFKSEQASLCYYPDAEYQNNCPEEDMEGNFDDVYEIAQDNGIAYEARKVLKAMLDGLG